VLQTSFLAGRGGNPPGEKKRRGIPDETQIPRGQKKKRCDSQARGCMVLASEEGDHAQAEKSACWGKGTRERIFGGGDKLVSDGGSYEKSKKRESDASCQKPPKSLEREGETFRSQKKNGGRCRARDDDGRKLIDVKEILPGKGGGSGNG